MVYSWFFFSTHKSIILYICSYGHEVVYQTKGKSKTESASERGADDICLNKRRRKRRLKEMIHEGDSDSAFYMCTGSTTAWSVKWQPTGSTTKKLWFEFFGQRKRCFSSSNLSDLLGGPLSLAIGGKPPTTSNQALHTIGGNNTHIVSSSWW